MRQAIVAIAIAVVGISGGSASADPVVITGGVASWDYGDPFHFDLSSGSFSVGGVGSFGDDPGVLCMGSTPCAPGFTVNLGANYEGPWQGIYGRTSVDPGRETFMSGGLSFASSTVTVTGGGVINAPFTFTGSLTGYGDPSMTGTPLFSHQLSGRGTVHWTLSASAEGLVTDEYAFVFESAAEPVPEPASMLLLGAGLAGLAARRRAIRGSRE